MFFSNGKMEGQVEIKYSNNEKVKNIYLLIIKYMGSLIGNLKEGNGIYSYPNGSRFEGNFKNDLPNGYGSFYYIDGVVF